ncbi:MAG: glycosyltransferase family 39 protein [Candidatus Omnitrophica bacterium]|nr:glycosyltransferase family 39 protein [Candidatus Omnitrophota bacterium]
MINSYKKNTADGYFENNKKFLNIFIIVSGILLMIVGIAIVRNSWINQRLLSILLSLKWYPINPYGIEKIKIFGINYLFFGFLISICGIFTKSLTTNKQFINILTFLSVLLITLVLFISLNRFLFIDEFEHIHSGWYVRHNYIPYTNFFQNHNPLLWYLMVPFYACFGETLTTVIALRLFMFILTVGISFITYLIAKTITKSQEVSLLTVLILLSTVMFIRKSIEIRPDVPYVLLGLISIYYIIRFFQTSNNKHIAFSGFCASLSFLFLQKIVFLLIAYAVIFLFRLLKRKVTVKSIVVFTIYFLVPLLFFLLFLIITGSLRDYFLTNWILHMSVERQFLPFVNLKGLLFYDIFFWLFSIMGIIFIFLGKKTNTELKISTFIGVVLLLLLYLTKFSYSQDFMLIIPLLSIAAGYFIKLVFGWFRLNITGRLFMILIIICWSCSFLLKDAGIKTNRVQFDKINFVLQNSQPSDVVYDVTSSFNLYRKDLHYFWYNFPPSGPIFKAYNKLTNDKYGDYNVYELIFSKRPKFISDYEVNISESGLEKLYRKTNFEHLYIRID